MRTSRSSTADMLGMAQHIVLHDAISPSSLFRKHSHMTLITLLAGSPDVDRPHMHIVFYVWYRRRAGGYANSFVALDTASLAASNPNCAGTTS